MRLWSLHPSYLDTQGLNGLWKEGCQALSVFGTDKGYSKHSQLERWDNREQLYKYMLAVYEESKKRGFNYNFESLRRYFKDTMYPDLIEPIPVSIMQVRFEGYHLCAKLTKREQFYKLNELSSMLDRVTCIALNPVFKLVSGPVAEWEKG
jgi:hypothetical protein